MDSQNSLDQARDAKYEELRSTMLEIQARFENHLSVCGQRSYGSGGVSSGRNVEVLKTAVANVTARVSVIERSGVLTGDFSRRGTGAYFAGLQRQIEYLHQGIQYHGNQILDLERSIRGFSFVYFF